MNKEELKLNIECAEFLKWRQHVQSFHIPDGTLNKFHENLYMRISDLHFHDSYDWAMLLVKFILDGENVNTEKSRMSAVLTAASWQTGEWIDRDWWDLTAYQISQACLAAK